MLRLRQRRPGGVWYVRGTVRIGKARTTIEEHSTGTAERSVADAYAAKLHQDTIAALLVGTRPEARRVAWEEAALAWARAHPSASARSRLRLLDRHFAGTICNEIDAAAFHAFARERLPGRHPNTIETYRIALLGILKAGGLTPPKIPSAKKPHKRGREWLAPGEADRLIEAYAPHVRPIAILARYQGLRAGELLRLRWRDIDFRRCTIDVRESKNGRGRRVPMHPESFKALWSCMAAYAVGGVRELEPLPLFCNRWGEAYADLRGKGGNPLSKAHRTACGRARLFGFRWHDWRHHWAHHCVKAGMDLVTLMRLGGWSSMEMVARYAETDMERAAELQGRVA